MTSTLTNAEKQMLLAARRMRQVVQADLERVMAPPSRKLLHMLGAEIRSLVTTLPDHTAVSLAQKVAHVVATGKSQTSTRNEISRILEKGGSKIGAATIVQAASLLHAKPNAALATALAQVEEARAELQVLREFI